MSSHFEIESTALQDFGGKWILWEISVCQMEFLNRFSGLGLLRLGRRGDHGFVAGSPFDASRSADQLSGGFPSSSILRKTV